MELAVTRNEQGFCCTTPNAEEPTRNVMLLRPKVAEKTPVEKLQPKSGAELQQTSGDDHQDGSGGYRFVNVNSAVNLGVQAVLDHQRAKPECDGKPELMPNAEVCRGLAVSEMMYCKKCGFHTDKTKLYTEIPRTGRGRRTATPNMALQVGLHNTGIAAAGAMRLLSAMDTTVPSRNALQKLSNKCGEIITFENKQDMSDKREIVKDIHELQGYNRESAVAVEADR